MTMACEAHESPPRGGWFEWRGDVDWRVLQLCNVWHLGPRGRKIECIQQIAVLHGGPCLGWVASEKDKHLASQARGVHPDLSMGARYLIMIVNPSAWVPHAGSTLRVMLEV
jgi:hypothetical protein